MLLTFRREFSNYLNRYAFDFPNFKVVHEIDHAVIESNIVSYNLTLFCEKYWIWACFLVLLVKKILRLKVKTHT